MNRNPDNWISNLHDDRRAGERELELLDVIKKGIKKKKKKKRRREVGRAASSASVCQRSLNRSSELLTKLRLDLIT